MEHPKRISEILTKPPISNSTNQSHSNFNTVINGEKQNLSKHEIEKFWKQQLIQSMKESSPSFTVDNRVKSILPEIYKWVWSRITDLEKGSLDPNKGILFWGPVGTGKTTLLKGIQHYLATINRVAFGYRNPDICIEIRSASEISLRYSSEGMNVLNKWTNRDQIGHLAIDEIGREEIAKHFGTTCNTLQTVFQLRYEHRNSVLTLGTTNLDMIEPSEFIRLYDSFILDRTKEMFNIVEIGGETRR